MSVSLEEYRRKNRSKRKFNSRTFKTAVGLGFIKKTRGSISTRCNKPRRTPGKRKKFAVLACDAKEMKIVRFGDPNMSHFREGKGAKQPSRAHGNARRRRSFKRRHRCQEKKDIMTPGYWSCNWSW